MDHAKRLLDGAKTSLKRLYDETGYFSNGDIKKLIAETQKKLEVCKNIEQTSCDSLLASFLLAFGEPGALKFVSLDFFCFLYSNSTPQFSPSEKVTNKLLATIISAPSNQSEDIMVKTVEFFSILVKSFSFCVISHEPMLFKMIYFMLQALKLYSDSSAFDALRGFTYATLQYFIKSLATASITESLYSRTVEKMMESFKLSQTLLMPFVPPFPMLTTVCEVDSAIAFTALAYSLKFDNDKRTILILALEVLGELLDSSVPLLRKPYFTTILSSVYLTLIQNAIETHGIVEPETTGMLILHVYEKIGASACRPICKFFKDALFPAYFQKFSTNVSKIIQALSNSPELFLDIHLHAEDENLFTAIVDNMFRPLEGKEIPSRNGVIAVFTLLKRLHSKLSLTSPSTEDIPSNEEPCYKEFSRSPPEGIAMFLKNGILKDNQNQTVSKFLYEDKKLDRFAKGYILATSNIAFFNSYLSWFNIKDLSFIEAFKKFFGSMFILNSPKAFDLMISCYAKFYHKEKKVTQSLECIYLLTCNTYLLHIDFYTQPNAKHMSLDDFIKMNRGINDGSNLDQDLLKSIYHGISEAQLFPIYQSPQLYKHQQISEIPQILMNEVVKKGVTINDRLVIVSQMLKPCKQTIINCLIKCYQMPNISTIMQTFLGSMIHIYSYCAQIYDNESIKALNEFFLKNTKLRNFPSSVTEQEVELSLTFIKSCVANLNFIINIWNPVLQELSAYLMKTKDHEIIDQLISRTLTLDRDQTLEFISSLVEVSKWELGQTQPRTMMLTKITDFVEAQINRPLFLWFEIWPSIQQLLIYAGTSSNQLIAEAAVGVLCQISIKLLELPVQKGFRFQNVFLSPFLEIFDQQTNKSIKEKIIVHCFELIKAHGKILRSGWDVLFQVFTSASMEQISYSTCTEIIQFIAEQMMELIIPYVIHMMTFASMHIMNTNDETEIVKEIHFFGTIAENMKNKLSDPWICLFDNIQRFADFSSQLASSSALETFINIIDSRKDMPQEAIEHFFNKIMIPVFCTPEKINYELSNNLYLSIAKHNEYIAQWKNIFQYISAIACDENEKAFDFLAQFSETALAEITKNPQPMYEILSELLQKFYCSSAFNEALIKIGKLFEKEETIHNYIQSMIQKIAEKNITPLDQYNHYLKEEKFSDIDSLLNEILLVFINSNEEKSKDVLFSLLKEVSELENEQFASATKQSMKLIVKLVRSNNSDVRDTIAPIIQKLV